MQKIYVKLADCATFMIIRLEKNIHFHKVMIKTYFRSEIKMKVGLSFCISLTYS